MSKIEWTEKTWNPIVGCSIVSPGCTNCYAMRMAARIEAMAEADKSRWTEPRSGAERLGHYAGTTKRVNGNHVWTGTVALAPDRILTEPLRRRKPTLYFVNSMGDLFHEDVPDEWIVHVFAVMALCPQHTFQVLTKRSARMRAFMTRRGWCPKAWTDGTRVCKAPWPLPNVWLGVSAERQQEADARIPDLLATPAAVRFVSAEPLLGPIDIYNGSPDPRLGGVVAGKGVHLGGWWERGDPPGMPARPGIDWVIVGGESGPGARPMHPSWARSIRDQCQAAGVPFFFKQWGGWALFADGDGDPDQRLAHRNDWMLVDRAGGLDVPDGRWPSLEDGECAMIHVGKSRAGRMLDGREWNDSPKLQQEARG